jgi:hypothetical protein
MGRTIALRSETHIFEELKLTVLVKVDGRFRGRMPPFDNLTELIDKTTASSWNAKSHNHDVYKN